MGTGHEAVVSRYTLARDDLRSFPDRLDHFVHLARQGPRTDQDSQSVSQSCRVDPGTIAGDYTGIL
jgi:hypothetical protein